MRTENKLCEMRKKNNEKIKAKQESIKACQAAIRKLRKAVPSSRPEGLSNERKIEAYRGLIKEFRDEIAELQAKNDKIQLELTSK